MSETILMTGATGFIGSHLLRVLVATGHDVIMLSRSLSSTERIRDVIGHVGRIDLDSVNLSDALSKVKFAGIIHLATDYGRRGLGASEVHQTNLKLPAALLKHAIKRGARFFINTDSFFCKPQFNYTAMQSYTDSKIRFREWARKNTESIHVANVVLEHVYGADDGQEKFVSSVLMQMLDPEVRNIQFTLGVQKRDFVYVDDVVNAYQVLIAALIKAKPGYSSYEVGTGSSVEVRYFAERLRAVTASQAQLIFGALAYREGEIMDSFADLSAISELGYVPNISLDTGIVRLVDAARKSLFGKFR